jgi:hypothetical protein
MIAPRAGSVPIAIRRSYSTKTALLLDAPLGVTMPVTTVDTVIAVNPVAACDRRLTVELKL